MDKVFSKPNKKQFEFDEAVASVFDDMLDRSVPLYEENIFLISHLIDKLFPDGADIIDLGCSTANTLLAIHKQNQNHSLIGFDNAPAMLEMAQKKCNAYGAKIDLKQADILNMNIPKSDVIIANYTLQFIRPPKRLEFVKKVCDAVKENGYFIFSEKIVYNDAKFDKVMIDLYLDFKKSQGYSEFEISQKREALENVLIPYTEEENFQMIKQAGFKNIQTISKMGNFATFIAFK